MPYVLLAMSANRSNKAAKRMRVREGGSGACHTNGHIHVISSATASEIRNTLRIKRTQIANILRAFEAAGVEV